MPLHPHFLNVRVASAAPLEFAISKLPEVNVWSEGDGDGAEPGTSEEMVV